MVNKERKRNLGIIDKGLKEQQVSTISDVVEKITKVVNDPKSSAGDLARIYETDQTSSANLLRIANSAYYNVAGIYVDNIRIAIVRVGYKAAQEIVMAATVCELFKDETLIGDYSRRDLWKNSMAAAIASRIIYTDRFKSHESYPFLSGLLRNIGIVFLDQFLHNYGFRDAISTRFDNETILVEEERKYLGITHEELAGEIAEKWNFSNELKYIMTNHHTMGKEVDKKLERLVNVIRLSELMCFNLEIGYSDFSESYKEVLTHSQEKLGIDDAALSSLQNSLSEEVKKIKESNWFLKNG
jgi:HD-like signal output (HDOD) protein